MSLYFQNQSTQSSSPPSVKSGRVLSLTSGTHSWYSPRCVVSRSWTVGVESRRPLIPVTLVYVGGSKGGNPESVYIRNDTHLQESTSLLSRDPGRPSASHSHLTSVVRGFGGWGWGLSPFCCYDRDRDVNRDFPEPVPNGPTLK